MSTELEAPEPFARLRQAGIDAMLAVACALSVWHVGAYLFIAFRRMFYPYTLEWMESGSLEHVARLLEGKQLYVAPSIDFAPFIYTPLYYWFCVPFARVFGLGLPSLRMVSVLASLAVFALLFAIVWKRSRNPFAGLIACGMFAGCFEVCGGFFDLARVDSLALCFLLFGTWVMLSSLRYDAWAGVFFAAAFLTKQSMALALPSLFALRLLQQQGVRRVLAPLVFAAIVVSTTWLQDRLSGGYYSYYVLRLPSQHAWVPSMRVGFWRYDMILHVPFAMVAALSLLTTRVNSRPLLQWWALALGFVALGWISRMHKGGYTNVLMPTMAFLAIALGETVSRLSTLRASPQRPLTLADVRATSPLSLFWLAVCVVQLTWLLYPVRSHIPKPAERKETDELVHYLRSIEGPILAPFDPLLPRLLGQPGNAHAQALTDITYGRERKPDQLAEKSVREALFKRRYAAIVVHGDWRMPEVKLGYTLSPMQVHTASPKEGASTSVSEVWLRRPDPTPKRAR